jgi:hypothetical protein
MGEVHTRVNVAFSSSAHAHTKENRWERNRYDSLYRVTRRLHTHCPVKRYHHINTFDDL